MLGFVFHAHLLVRVDQMRGKERRGAGIAVPLCRLEAVQVVLGGHVKPAFLRGGGGPEVGESDFVDVQAWVHDNNLRCLSAPILFLGPRGCVSRFWFEVCFIPLQGFPFGLFALEER
jgi:hypothetical protein